MHCLLQGVKAADLEQALLVLPFTDALRLLEHLLEWLAAGLQVRAVTSNPIAASETGFWLALA